MNSDPYIFNFLPKWFYRRGLRMPMSNSSILWDYTILITDVSTQYINEWTKLMLSFLLLKFHWSISLGFWFFLTDCVGKVTHRCFKIFVLCSDGWECGEGLLICCFGCKFNLGINPRQSLANLNIKRWTNVWP